MEEKERKKDREREKFESWGEGGTRSMWLVLMDQSKFTKLQTSLNFC